MGRSKCQVRDMDWLSSKLTNGKPSLQQQFEQESTQDEHRLTGKNYMATGSRAGDHPGPLRWKSHWRQRRLCQRWMRHPRLGYHFQSKMAIIGFGPVDGDPTTALFLPYTTTGTGSDPQNHSLYPKVFRFPQAASLQYARTKDRSNS